MLLNRLIKKKPINLRFLTTFDNNVKSENFRTAENDPDQNKNNVGLFYTLPIDLKKNIFLHGGFPKSFEKQIKTFGETCIMVREPALEIIDFIKKSGSNKPVNRYIIYGKNGVGKSLVLSHVMHYCFSKEYILVHIPWVPNWFKKPKEIATSALKEGFIDLPIDAAAWLIHFKTQNQQLLQKLNLTTSQDLVWSKREVTAKGANLLELIEHGISRVKFASCVIEALLNELKIHSTNGLCKTLVAIDGYNAFFNPDTRIFIENRVRISPEKVTLTKPFLDICKWNWKNGIVVVTVDTMASVDDNLDSELPLYLLRKRGFEHMDPFIPIQVENYTEAEFTRCIEYYLNRRWIQNVKTGFDTELKFLSGKNPFKLMELCKSL